MNNQSLYEIICENITSEGKLPSSFSVLRKNESPNQIKFAPGALDGVSIYHAGGGDVGEIVKQLETILRNAWKKDNLFKTGENNQYDKDAKLIENLLCGHSVLSFIDVLLKSIRSDNDKIDITKLREYANNFAFKSSDENLVKLGICLYGLFRLENDKPLLDKLYTLSLYDEFTLYVVVAISGTENSNELVFDIAKKVDGWGKIHAVNRLNPSTKEIKDWLLCKGCENSVMNSYLGLVCANNGDLISALRYENLDEELFDGISIIINALLDEGPMQGISEYAGSKEALSLYLNIAKLRDLKINHLWGILNIEDYLIDSDIDNKEQLLIICKKIKDMPKWKEVIENILDSDEETKLFYAINTANRLEFDISNHLFKAVMKNPIKHSGYLSLVFKNKEYAQKIIQLYEEILPFDKLEKGMGNYSFATTFKDEHRCIDFVLQELTKYPKMGEKIIEYAINSPVIRERNGAIKALKAWSDFLQKPLLEISPKLFSDIKKVEMLEVNEKTKERISNLIQAN